MFKYMLISISKRLFFLLFLLILQACEEKEFNNYFKDLKEASLHNRFQGFSLYPLRDLYHLSHPDSGHMIFDLNKNYNFRLKSFDSISDIAIAKQELSVILKECKKLNIIMFQTIRKTFVVYFDLRFIKQNTLLEYVLPKYVTQTIREDESIIGVLVYAYNENYEKSRSYKNRKPIKLGDKWYYYTTPFRLRF